MANRCVKRAAVSILCLLLLGSIGCNIKPLVIPPSQVKTPQPVSEADIVGGAGLPAGGRRTSYELTDTNSASALAAAYDGISLKSVLDFLDTLETAGWYLNENGAYRGSRSVRLFYNMDQQYLSLDYLYEKNVSEWPADVLTPYLAYVVPPFSSGKYDGFEEKEFDCGDAIQLIFRDVSRGEMDEYLSLLESKADQTIRSKRFYIGRTFVDCEYFLKTARVSVGLNRDFGLAPLPPWPDLPDFLQRALPVIHAVLTVRSEEDGAFVLATGVSLTDLYSFFKSSLKNGWVPIPDDGSGSYSMELPEYDIKLMNRSYRSDTEIWNLNLYGVW